MRGSALIAAGRIRRITAVSRASATASTAHGERRALRSASGQIAYYELLTAAGISSVVRCGIAILFIRCARRPAASYALDIPYIARENSTAEILALKKAWARAGG
jgi:hypothetical protein